MIKRREFIIKTAMGAAAIPLSGLSCSRNTGTGISPAGEKVIDAHIHLVSSRIKDALEVMDENKIRYAVLMASISGAGENLYEGDKAFYELAEALRPYKNRLGLHYSFDWTQAQTDPEFFIKAPDMLEKAVAAGALGLKNLKELGLKAIDHDGKLIAIDDPRLFPIWERAGKLGIPVAFHTGDPVAFFKPWDSSNERWDELKLHPEWSFADRSKYPALETLFEQVKNVYRSFPNVHFVSVHVGGYSENLDAVGNWLDELPNLSIDTAARIGELGRHLAEKGHDFFTRYQDRIMFGTDLQFWSDCDVQGAGPCKAFTKEEHRNFYETHWRYFQTRDRHFNHPTPIQGDWKIDGIGLDKNVLKKLYWANAFRFFRLDRFNVS